MILIETTLWDEGQTVEKGLLPNVVILGQTSRNKRFYTEPAMRDAIPLYEGRAVYISHAGEKVKHRPAPERYGRLKNVRFDEATKKLRGDLVYLESQQQMSSMLKEDIDRKLNFFGLSHVADGEWHLKDGVKVVTKITKVTSVDVVSDPATNTSLMEQADATPPVEGGPDPKVEALRGGLTAILDKGGDVASLVTAINEFMDTFAKGAGKAEEPVKEQFDAAGISKLVEQTVTAAIEKLKPKKYVTPTGTLTEQTLVDAAPKDKAALKKWLNR